MKTRIQTISLVASTLLAGSLFLTGCGGGGGGGDESSPSTSTATLSLKGVAVDELIVDGVVNAYADSASGPLLASGRTDGHGAYTLSVKGFDGVAVIKVECDTRSKLYFPETNTTEICPQSLRLFSATPVSKTADDIVVNTTPATYAMFKLATGGDLNATLDKAKVDTARNQIALALGGVDPVATDPVTNPHYKAVVAAFQEAAKEANTSTMEIVEKFAEDAQDGEFGDDHSDVVKLIAQKMEEHNVTSPFVQAVEQNETYTPPTNAADMEAITQAKAFFASLRTQGESLVEEEGFFDTEAQAIEAALDNVSLNTDLAAKALGNVLFTVLGAIEKGESNASTTIVDLGSRSRRLTVTETNATLWNYRFEDLEGMTVTKIAEGTVTMPDINYSNVDESVLDTFTTLSAAFEGTVPATYLSEAVQKVQTFRAKIRLDRTSEGADATVDEIALSTPDGTKIGVSRIFASLGYDYNASNTDEPLTPNFVKLETLTLDGALDHAYSASGTLGIGYTTNASLAKFGGMTETYVSEAWGVVDCPLDGIYDYNGTATYDTNGTTLVAHVNNGFFHMELSGEHDFNDWEDFLRFDGNKFTFSPACHGAQFVLQGSETHREETKIGNSGYVPNRLSFDGNITNQTSGSRLSGYVRADLLNVGTMDLGDLEKVTEEPLVKVAVGGTLSRPGIDDTVLTIDYANALDPMTKKTSGHNVTASYVYSGTSVHLKADMDRKGETGLVELTSGTGLAITLQIKEGDIDYADTTPLTKDGKVIGHLDDETGIPRIKYIDGSFESLP